MLGAPARAQPWPQPPAWLLADFACIHRYETGLQALTNAEAWPLRWDDRANPYSRGGLQFEWGTWRSLGGIGDPASASRGEQVFRAWRLWMQQGFNPWTTAGDCGL